jgi:UDP-N-acetylmuramyl pentapeptide phosphotransferase/UDP-N-acetylglucosamine-1-phosphate transferase
MDNLSDHLNDELVLGLFDPAFLPLAGLSGCVFVGVVILVGITRAFLLRREILDVPNERSSHATPTPRGGGIGVILVLLPAWGIWTVLAAGSRPPPDTFKEIGLIYAAVVVLAAVSWLDDLRGLGSLPRLLSHFVAAALAVWALDLMVLDPSVFEGMIFGYQPPAWTILTVVTILLVWFINLFNFMDGIDGISGVETIVIGLGAAVVALVGLAGGAMAGQGLILAFAGLGFLVWNWPPARVFLGDVGSTPLGLLCGWALLSIASQGLWLSAVILPLYYLADSGLTLVRRALRGENIARAHRSHFYQKAAQNGRSHAAISLAVLAIGAVLIAHSIVAAMFDPSVAWPTLISACVCVGLTLAWMTSPSRSQSSKEA